MVNNNNNDNYLSLLSKVTLSQELKFLELFTLPIYTRFLTQVKFYTYLYMVFLKAPFYHTACYQYF